MFIKLTISKQSLLTILLNLFFYSHNTFAQNEIKDCNGNPITVQTIIVRSSTGANLTTSNCTFSNGSLSAYLNCIRANNPSLPTTASFIVELTANPASGISGLDFALLKQDVLQSNLISNTCNRVGSDSDMNNKINTIDLCLLRRHNLGISNINPSWKFYKSQNLSLSGIGSATDLVFPVTDFPLSTLHILGVHNGNVNQVTSNSDTCVLLCKPTLTIIPGIDEVRKLTPDYFLLNKSCEFPNLTLQIMNESGKIIGNDITQNLIFSQLTAQLKIGNTSQICTTKLRVWLNESIVNIDVDQINIQDSTFIDLTVRNAEFIAGYQLSLKFDTSLLQFIIVEKGNEVGFNVSTDAHHNGKGHVNFSRFNDISNLDLKEGTRLFRVKFKRKSSVINNVVIDPENVETLFFDSNKNEYFTDITYIKDTQPPVCIQDTINIQTSLANGYGIVKFTDYASDDFGTVLFVSGVNEFDIPITENDSFDCGTNILTYVVFKDANGQLKECVFRVIVDCPMESCNNKYLYFDGINDRINIPNQHTGNINFTLEAWFKSDNIVDQGINTFHRLFTLGTANRMELGDQSGRLIYFDGSFFPTGPNIRDGKWHHVAIVRESPFVNIVLDGVQIFSRSATTVDLSSLRIGYFNNNSVQPPSIWKGGIDEIKLWNRPLSLDEIKDSKDKINTNRKDCGLIGYWRMEDGNPNENNQSVTMIRDSIQNNHGTLVGFDLVGPTSNFSCNDSLSLILDTLGCCGDVKPTFENCPTKIIGFADENCASNINFPIPVVFDPCNGLEALVNCTREDNLTLASSYSLGTTKITCIVVASNLLRDSCIFDVEVRDTIKPICNGKTLNKIINTNGNASFSAMDLNDNSTDNCSDVIITASNTMFTCEDLGQTNFVPLTVTDESGNSSSCQVEVKLTDPNNYCACINDTTPPVCKSKNINIYLDENGQATLSATQIDNGSVDGCSAVTLMVEGATSFDCNSLGQNFVALVTTDQSNNVSFCESEITILDTIAPVCRSKTINLVINENGTATFNAEDLNNNSTDNCGPNLLFSAPDIDYTCQDLNQIHIVELTVIDLSGNKSSCPAEIKLSDPNEFCACIVDITPPECKSKNIDLYLNTNGQSTLTAAQIDNGSIDNCSAVTLMVEGLTSFNCNNIGQNFVALVATDQSNNVNFCESLITVRDTIKPVCNISNLEITATDSTGAFVTFNGTTTDNCILGLTLSYSQPFSQFYPCGEYNITMTARDGSMNVSTCPFKLTVKDCDGCCLSESSFMTNTNVDFNLSSDLNSEECVIQFVTPALTECQKVTEISWGDGTVSRGSFTNAVDFTHQYAEPAIYEVCVTYEEANQQNCFNNKKCNSFEVLDNCTLKRSVGQFDYDKIILVPNPTSSSFSISSGSIFSHYSIYNQIGKEVVPKRSIETVNDISHLLNGVYFVRLTVGSINVTKRIIKIQ